VKVLNGRAYIAIGAFIAVTILAYIAYMKTIPLIGTAMGLTNNSFYQKALVPHHRFERLYGVPVVVDEGTMTAATFSLTLGLIPATLYASRRFRELREYEEQIVTLLLMLPGMLAATASTADALLRASRILRPPFSNIVEKAARLYRTTGDIEGAVRKALQDDDIPPMVRIAAGSIPVASKAGGRVHEVLSRLASYLEASRRLTQIAEARLAEYKLIAVLAVLAYSATAGATLALISKASNVNLPGITFRIDVGLLTGLFYYSLIVITLGSAIVIARVIYGYTPLTAKYLLILLPVGYLTFILAPLMV
jgi:hypothetical protein